MPREVRFCIIRDSFITGCWPLAFKRHDGARTRAGLGASCLNGYTKHTYTSQEELRMSQHRPRRKHRTENQHYVPQFYLRGFTNDGGRMFCYDKVADKSYPTSTTAAAQEPYFYEIPPGSFRKVNIPVNTVEKALSVVESTWAPLHAALIK